MAGFSQRCANPDDDALHHPQAAVGGRAPDRRLRPDVRLLPGLPDGRSRRAAGGARSKSRADQGDQALARSRPFDAGSVLEIHQGRLPALRSRLQLLQPPVGAQPDLRTAARDAVADDRRRRAMGAGGAVGGDHLGAAASLADRPRLDGHRAAADLGPGILARSGRVAPVLTGHRQIPHPARLGHLRGPRAGSRSTLV